jgi:putative tricarboxylic transport membrane protein
MSEGPDGRPALGVKGAEIALALFFLALGAIVVYDSARLGARWADDGPQTGYFPFYIGALICVASLANLIAATRAPQGRTFVEVGQLKLVLAVLVPSAIYVALIGWLGIYVASALFIAFFMRRLGHFAWWKTIAVSIGNSVVFFLIFEVWFKIPLPKGPLENLLGIA